MHSGQYSIIHASENRRANKERPIQRHWQHWVRKTQDVDKQSKQNTIHKSDKMRNTDLTKMGVNTGGREE